MMKVIVVFKCLLASGKLQHGRHLLFFERLRVLNVVIHSPSVDGVSTASEYAYLRFDKRFELEFVSTCLKPARLNLARLLGFNRTSTPITRNMDKQL